MSIPKWLVWRENHTVRVEKIYSGSGGYRTSVLDLVPSFTTCEIIAALIPEQAIHTFEQRHPDEQLDRAT